MPVKIEPHIVEELQAMDLVLWECRHPKRPVWNEAKGKNTDREDKEWVIVSLAGPGVPNYVGGGGKTLRLAVDAALTHFLPDRVRGLRGAVMRLEKAMFDLGQACVSTRWKIEGDDLDDGDIPF